MNDLTRKFQAEESLIAKAKAEYTKKTMPRESKTAGGDGKSMAASNCSVWRKERGSLLSLPGKLRSTEYTGLINHSR